MVQLPLKLLRVVLVDLKLLLQLFSLRLLNAFRHVFQLSIANFNLMFVLFELLLESVHQVLYRVIKKRLNIPHC